MNLYVMVPWVVVGLSLGVWWVRREFADVDVLTGAQYAEAGFMVVVAVVFCPVLAAALLVWCTCWVIGRVARVGA